MRQSLHLPYTACIYVHTCREILGNDPGSAWYFIKDDNGNFYYKRKRGIQEERPKYTPKQKKSKK